MDFWTTTWSAVLGGVITFILTAVPMGMVERRRRAKRSRLDESAPPTASDDHSVSVDVSGQNHGPITAKVADNRSYRSSKKVKTVVNQPARPAQGSGSDSDTAASFGLIGVAVVGMLVLATAFVWAYSYLFIGMACALGVVLGMIAAMCRESYEATGAWSHRASGMVIRAGALSVAFIATWLVLRSTVRGVMSLEAMNRTVVAAPDAVASTTNPVALFLSAGFERVKTFFTVYGPAGAGFAVFLLLSLFVLVLVMLSLVRSCIDWSLFVRQHGGERLPKRLRRRAKAFGSRSPRMQVVGLIGFIAACVVAVLLATGLGFDGMTLLQNGLVPAVPTP